MPYDVVTTERYERLRRGGYGGLALRRAGGRGLAATNPRAWISEGEFIHVVSEE